MSMKDTKGQLVWAENPNKELTEYISIHMDGKVEIGLGKKYCLLYIADWLKLVEQSGGEVVEEKVQHEDSFVLQEPDREFGLEPSE